MISKREMVEILKERGVEIKEADIVQESDIVYADDDSGDLYTVAYEGFITIKKRENKK